jgi:hypothetical protein
MMPYWAEKIGVPRTLAVEFPFGQTLGGSGNTQQQMRVIRQALSVLATTVEPGTTIHSAEVWPQDVQQAIQGWQPEKPSPIIAELSPHFREMLRQRRKG